MFANNWTWKGTIQSIQSNIYLYPSALWFKQNKVDVVERYKYKYGSRRVKVAHQSHVPHGHLRPIKRSSVFPLVLFMNVSAVMQHFASM